MNIRAIEPEDHAEWLRMRRALWPECPDDLQEEEMSETLSLPDIRIVLVAERKTGGLGGFVEVQKRKRMNNAESPIVAYVEGWYIDPDLRRKGLGRQLIRAAESWAWEQGLCEIASDTELTNQTSIDAHHKLGFEEAFRLVHFIKDIDPPE